MKSNCAGVEAVLAALAFKINQSRVDLDAQAIGNALYGLQGMDGSSAGAEAMLVVRVVQGRGLFWMP